MALKRWQWRLAWLLVATLLAAILFAERYYRSTKPMITILNNQKAVVDCRVNVKELCQGTVQIEIFRQLTSYDIRRMVQITDPADIAKIVNSLNTIASWRNRVDKEFDSNYYQILFHRRFRKDITLYYRPDWGFIRVLGLDVKVPAEFARRVEPYVDKPAPILQH